MLHKDYQINKIVHSTSTAMQWLTKVSGSTRPSETLANAVHEPSQSTQHKDFTYSLSVILQGKYRQQEI